MVELEEVVDGVMSDVCEVSMELSMVAATVEATVRRNAGNA